MTMEKMTMHEKLLIIKYMIERGELIVELGIGDREERFDELAAEFTPDRDRVKIEI